MDKAGAPRLVHFTTDMIYGHTVTHPMTEDHPVAPLGEYGWSKQKTEELAAEWRKRGMQHLAVPPAADHRAGPSRHPGKAVQADRLEPAGADDRLGQEPLPVHLGVRLRRSGARRLQGRRAERGLQSRLAQPAAGARSCSATSSGMPARNRCSSRRRAGRSSARSTCSISSTCRSWIPSSI